MAAFGYYASGHPMDFRVYHFGATGVFDGTRSVYGISSGLGWPMHYRYPPLFLLLFAPFTLLPLDWGAALWVAAKVALFVVVIQAILKRVRNPARGIVIETSKPNLNSRMLLLSFLFIGPYLVEEFRYGNAQFFVLALTIAALLIARERPLLAASSLALGICIKVWPLFFVPYLAARRDWKVVSCTLLFVVLLMLVPSFYFGFQGNLRLIGEWYTQEFQTQLGENEIWFPNQSLRGVLMRYLTVIDYSTLPDSNYPQVNIANFDPRHVLFCWVTLAGTAYVGLLLLASWRKESEGWFEHGLAFCLLALLQPFTQKYALAVLLWPALMVGFLAARPSLRLLIYMATVLAIIQPLIPGAAVQRMFQVLGTDFAATALLCSAYIVGAITRTDLIDRNKTEELATGVSG
jgi:hypothetical protein